MFGNLCLVWVAVRIAAYMTGKAAPSSVFITGGISISGTNQSPITQRLALASLYASPCWLLSRIACRGLHRGQ
jgi:hypothetical protein